MTSVLSKLTYDEFQTLPRDGSKRLELIEGEVMRRPASRRSGTSIRRSRLPKY
jgi:hypothetical protein